VSDELTSREVAEMLGVSTRSVLYAAERGDLQGRSIPKGKKRYWRFNRTNVEAYQRSIREQSQGESDV
jgi:excisionase family DNA binding protein